MDSSFKKKSHFYVTRPNSVLLPKFWHWMAANLGLLLSPKSEKMLSFPTAFLLHRLLPATSTAHQAEIHRRINQSWLPLQKDREMDTTQTNKSSPEQLVTSNTHSIQWSEARVSWIQSSQEPKWLREETLVKKLAQVHMWGELSTLGTESLLGNERDSQRLWYRERYRKQKESQSGPNQEWSLHPLQGRL